MPTSNITVTTSWSKIADSSDDHFLISTTSAAYIEYAVTSNGVPTIGRGHTLSPGESLTRAAIGGGHVYARVNDQRFETAILAVTK